MLDERKALFRRCHLGVPVPVQSETSKRKRRSKAALSFHLGLMY